MMDSDTAPLDDNDLYASVDVLASDFIARYRSGDRPTIDEYASRHPELSEPIRRVFPLVLSVEKVKVDQQTGSDGSASLAGRLIEHLGDFRLVREIGRGGMGIVYEALQQSLGRTVAIKVLPKQSLLDDDALERFQHEAKTAAAMHHSNIVPIFGTGETDGTHYLVMQLVRGESLDKRIAARGRSAFGFQETALIGRQIADALAYSHSSGVLHRDIKPANVLIDENGIAQVTDFGLARNTRDDPTMTQALSGSPRYMAPERFSGQSDERCDIYALGLTLYEMAAGVPAFGESDPQQLMESVRLHHVKSIGTLRPDIPIDLQTIITKAISREPAHRYQTAADVRDDLGRFLADEPIQARRTSAAARLVRWCRRNPKVATATTIAAASLLLATLASTGGWVLTSAANQRTTAALYQSEQTVDLALQSLDGIVDMVSVPATNINDVSLDDSAATTYSLNPSPHTAQVLQSIQPLYERLSQQSPTRPDIVQQMIRATIRLALIRRQLGQTADAITSIEHGINVLDDRAETAGLSATKRQLLSAQLQNALGDIYAVELRFEDSDNAFRSAIAAASQVSQNDSESRLQIARAHLALGDPPPHRRRMESGSSQSPQELREHLRTANELLATLSKTQEKSNQVATLRARVLLAQSSLEKRPAAKRTLFQNAIEILRQQLNFSPNDTTVRYTLVEALAAVNLRREAQTNNQRAAAVNRLNESLVELKPLQQQFPVTPSFSISEIHIRHKLSNLARTDGSLDEANAQLQRAINVQSSLVNATPENLSHRCWRALLYRSLAEVHHAQENPTAKRNVITRAAADMDAIQPTDRQHPFVVQTRQIIDELAKQAL